MVKHEPDETVGRRIRRLRRAKKLTQTDLGVASGISTAQISRIESGKRAATLGVLRRIAPKLGVSAEYLETGERLTATQQRDLRLSDAELALRLSEEEDEIGEVEQVFTALLKEAVTAGDHQAEVRARIGLGAVATHRAAWTAVVRRLGRLALDPSIHPATHPGVFINLGHAYVELGRADECVALFHQCLRRLRGRKHDVAYIRLAVALSSALCDMGELNEADRVIKLALRRGGPTLDPYSRARVYWSMARVEIHRDDSEAAQAYSRRAVALLEMTENTHDLARAHLLGADIALSAKRLDEAEAEAAQAEITGSALGAHDRALLRATQARLAALAEDGARAVALAEEAAELARDDPPFLGRAEWAKAEGLAVLGEWQAAFAAFEKASKLINERFTAELYESWARTLDAAGQKREADALRRKEKTNAQPTR